jgi:hypothetical protein
MVEHLVKFFAQNSYTYMHHTNRMHRYGIAPLNNYSLATHYSLSVAIKFKRFSEINIFIRKNTRKKNPSLLSLIFSRNKRITVERTFTDTYIFLSSIAQCSLTVILASVLESKWRAFHILLMTNPKGQSEFSIMLC